MNLCPEPIASTYDFDGTIALTSEACPGGMDVDEAYEAAIAEELGTEQAERFVALGGNLSRTPLEIVADLQPTLDANQSAHVAESVTQHKLDILLGQIGTPFLNGKYWPRPTVGFPESWVEVHEKRSRDRIIATAIISAGHESFIRKWFATYNLPLPDELFSVERITDVAYAKGCEPLAKPSPLLMDWVLDPLVGRYGTRFSSRIHHGDSYKKDGQFAENSGAMYLHVSAQTVPKIWQMSADILLGR